MPFSIRPFRRFRVQCPVTYNSDLLPKLPLAVPTLASVDSLRAYRLGSRGTLRHRALPAPLVPGKRPVGVCQNSLQYRDAWPEAESRCIHVWYQLVTSLAPRHS